MIKFIIFIFILIQFIYSQDKGLSSFEKENYKESFDYYLKVLESRENDISAKFGAGISAFKNQDIETGMKYLQEVSNSEDEILSSRAHFNLANIYKDENAFVNEFGYERPVMRDISGEPLLSLRRFIQYENVLGSSDSYLNSGGQFSAHTALYSPKGENGLPEPLFDSKTGEINHSVAEYWKKYDFKLEKVGKHYTWHGANGAIIVTSKTPGKARYLKEIECNIRKQLSN